LPYDRNAEFQDLVNEWRECSRCSLSKERNCLVFGAGPVNAEIMVIGEGPGQDEDLEGRPFIGQSGKLLNHLIKMSGLERAAMYITNLVCCRPTSEIEEHGKLRKKDRPPSKTEINACWPRLEKLIYVVDPVVILAAGKTAALRLTGKKTQKEALKDVFPVRIPGKGRTIEYPVLSIYHPAFLLRQGNKADLFHATVDQLKHLKMTVEAFKKLGQDRPWKEKKTHE